MKTCEILKTKIAVTDMEETLHYIEEHLDGLRGRYVCVSNVHTTVMSYDNEEYRNIQNSAAFALPDGKPLSVVSRFRRFPEAKRVTGPDLMEEMFKLSEKTGYRHYFYGSTDNTLVELAGHLHEKYPALVIAGMYAPPFREMTEEEDGDAIERIRSAKADIIWVGLGAPKQEQWMYRHKGQTAALMFGVGAGFDFHAGTVKRAPKWVQNIGMEWFYRICQDPKRLWKRYLTTNLRFIWLVMRGK